MEYIVDSKTYSFDYQELKEKYLELESLTDIQFLDRIPEILHFVCFVSYVKNTPSYILLNDRGLIHELVHLLDLKGHPTNDLENIREQFKIWCKLV